MDLSLQDADSPLPRPAVVESPYFGDSRMQSGDDIDAYKRPAQGPVFFRLQEDRIVRSGELRYFDHPRFGVIAKIMRVEEPKREPGQIGQGDGSISGVTQRDSF
jgi:hypothetical protein